MNTLLQDVALPTVALSGFEPGLNEQEAAVQESLHRFAADVMRPVGRELDRMSAKDIIAPGSPFWAFHKGAAGLGLDPSAFAALGPAGAARMEAVVFEELAWGDVGLAISAGAGGLALDVVRHAGKPELVDLCTDKLGCWIVTQPDRGSDVTSLYASERHPAAAQGSKGNLTARVSADEIVLNGQSSAWISNGSVAQVALMSVSADYGDGFFADDGRPYGIACVCPLDLRGVSRGKPLEKLGQRPLPQGEVFFDNVRIPRRFAIAERDTAYATHAYNWSHAGTIMGQCATGAARAAFELALAYVHERKQGGAFLHEHQLTQYRLGEMGRRVELIRAVSRRTTEYAKLSPQSHPYFTGQSKVTCTSEALVVVNEALQLFGGNGLTDEYPLEKLLRDTRAMLIEDGENYVLSLRFGGLLSKLYQAGWAR